MPHLELNKKALCVEAAGMKYYSTYYYTMTYYYSRYDIQTNVEMSFCISSWHCSKDSANLKLHIILQQISLQLEIWNHNQQPSQARI